MPTLQQEPLFQFEKAGVVREMIPIGEIATPIESEEPSAFLVRHIRDHGILSPLILRHVEGNAARPYTIIDGRRRFLAQTKIILDDDGDPDLFNVPAVVVGADDTPAAALTLAMQASQTANLVVEIAMVDELFQSGLDAKQIASRTGLKVSQVNRLARMARATVGFRDRLEEMPTYAIEAMSSLSEQQRDDVFAWVDGIHPVDHEPCTPLTYQQAIKQVKQVQLDQTFSNTELFDDPPPLDPLVRIKSEITTLSPAYRRELAAWLTTQQL